MLKKIIAGSALVLAASSAHAALMESQSAVVAVAPTDYQSVLMFNQFDDMGGSRILQSVTFSIDGQVTGSAEFENLGANASTIEYNYSATLTLSDPMANELVVSIPGLNDSFDASAFDGTIDFGGTSGITLDDLNESQYEEETYMDAPTLAAFTGVGTIDLTFDAAGSSRVVGGGNIISRFLTNAGGTVKVVYMYTEQSVSAPTSIALLGLTLLGLASVRRDRK